MTIIINIIIRTSLSTLGHDDVDIRGLIYIENVLLCLCCLLFTLSFCDWRCHPAVPDYAAGNIFTPSSILRKPDMEEMVEKL